MERVSKRFVSFFRGMSSKLLVHSFSSPFPLQRFNLCPRQCQCVMGTCLWKVSHLHGRDSMWRGGGGVWCGWVLGARRSVI